MEEIAEVYARSLFEVAQEHDISTRSASSSTQFAAAFNDRPPAGRLLLLAVLLDRGEEGGLRRAVKAPTDLHELPRGADRAPPDARHLPDPHRFQELWDDVNKLLPVQITSAVPLSEATAIR